MGGSSSGGGPLPPPRQPPQPQGDVCDLIIDTSVNGPDPQVLSTVSVGTVLTVTLGGQAQRVIQAVTPQGQILGAIVGAPQAGTLIRCIGQQHTYIATITSIAGGLVEVQITRASTP